MNEIVFPAAILQDPFFDPGRRDRVHEWSPRSGSVALQDQDGLVHQLMARWVGLVQAVKEGLDFARKAGAMADFSVVFFGTSIMEHMEAHSAALERQHDLPGIGESVVVDSHRHRGWVHFLFLRLQASMPGVRFIFGNRGLGGATSRDVLRVVREAVAAGPHRPDLVVLGVGINDVWRSFQDRPDQAVGLDEYGGGPVAAHPVRGPAAGPRPVTLVRRSAPDRTRRHHRGPRGRARHQAVPRR